MNAYETLFIANPNLSEEELDVLIAKVQDVINKAGDVKETDKWGKKRLAYEIQKLRDGYYTLITFEAEASVLDELNHIYKISDDILRGIYVKLEK